MSIKRALCNLFIYLGVVSLVLALAPKYQAWNYYQQTKWKQSILFNEYHCSRCRIADSRKISHFLRRTEMFGRLRKHFTNVLCVFYKMFWNFVNIVTRLDHHNYIRKVWNKSESVHKDGKIFISNCNANETFKRFV